MTVVSHESSCKKYITYFYRGLVERPSSGAYDFFEGFSERSANGNPLYPWMTRSECRAYASMRGCVARFVYRDNEPFSR